jgi:transcriptional regulator with XRE-family HTH domain
MFDFTKAFKTLKAQTGKKNAHIASETGKSMATISNWCTGKAEPSLREVGGLCSNNKIKLSTFIQWGE